jgi:nitroreductase
MNVIEAIYARQSVGNVKPDEIARADIEKLLGAAAQAPNHYKVRPWRFVVIAGEARSRFGEAMAQSFLRKSPQVGKDGLEKERAKPFRAPLIIAVGVDGPSEPRVQEIENVCAAAAACQNILLAALELGIAGYWRTGDAARDPEVKALLGMAPDQELIAFLYLGYQSAPAEPRQRQGFEDRTTWLE